MAAYYNEIDPFAAAWLRELIKAGLIADGEVDERSIADVRPDDLRGFTQCHFFAGIGVWSYALRLAGWPDDRPVWTGSCPCQPFSAAGRRGGFDDERHLWPYWHGLIAECKPAVVFGEQVASPDGLKWLDIVSSDLEGEGYALGAADLCAAGIGAPHIRQRLWFVADADDAGSQGRERGELRERADQCVVGTSGASGGLELACGIGRQRREGAASGCEYHGPDAGWQQGHDGAVGANQGGDDGVADSGREGRRQVGADAGGRGEGSGTQGVGQRPLHSSDSVRPGPTNGYWRDADWLCCRDGKWRPVEPGTFPLAHGAPARVGRLRGYGNAIVAPLAAEVIGAYMEIRS